MIFNLLERHRDKWVEDGECYKWLGATEGSRSPQPVVGVGKTRVRVTRAMCEEVRGPPPTPKHYALHDTANGCIGRLCVNGEHLRWGTQKENMADIPAEIRSARIYAGRIGIKKTVSSPMFISFSERRQQHKVVYKGTFLGYFSDLTDAVAALNKHIEGLK